MSIGEGVQRVMRDGRVRHRVRVRVVALVVVLMLLMVRRRRKQRCGPVRVRRAAVLTRRGRHGRHGEWRCGPKEGGAGRDAREGCERKDKKKEQRSNQL